MSPRWGRTPVRLGKRRRLGLQLGRDPAPGGGIAKAFGADRHAGGARGEEIGGMRARWRSRPSRSAADRPRRPPRSPARAPPPAPPARRPRPCRRRATAAALRGSSAMPLSVLISDTASAPASSAARATAAGSLAFGRELHDQRLRAERAHGLARPARSRRDRRPSRARSPRSGRTRSARSAPPRRARPRAATSVASSSRLKPITDTTSGTGSSASSGRSEAEEALEPLVGQPDRVDQAGRGLPQARRRVALARLERDRLRDEGVEGEALEQRVAEGPPGGDRVEGARSR